MAAGTEGDHQVQQRLPRFPVMHDDRPLTPLRRTADPATVAIAGEDRLAQAAKICFILPLQGVTSGAQTAGKDFRAATTAMYRPLYAFTNLLHLPLSGSGLWEVEIPFMVREELSPRTEVILCYSRDK